MLLLESLNHLVPLFLELVDLGGPVGVKFRDPVFAILIDFFPFFVMLLLDIEHPLLI